MDIFVLTPIYLGYKGHCIMNLWATWLSKAHATKLVQQYGNERKKHGTQMWRGRALYNETRSSMAIWGACNKTCTENGEEGHEDVCYQGNEAHSKEGQWGNEHMQSGVVWRESSNFIMCNVDWWCRWAHKLHIPHICSGDGGWWWCIDGTLWAIVHLHGSLGWLIMRWGVDINSSLRTMGVSDPGRGSLPRNFFPRLGNFWTRPKIVARPAQLRKKTLPLHSWRPLDYNICVHFHLVNKAIDWDFIPEVKPSMKNVINLEVKKLQNPH